MNTPLLTDDGSMSFYSERFRDTYHSRHGAIQEARHVFIGNGLRALPPDVPRVSIVEMGFGTGLNALLTALEPLSLDINYTALDLYPLSDEELRSVNHVEVIGDPRAREWWERMMTSPWGIAEEIRPGFKLRKIQDDMLTWTPDQEFDVVFYDAFAPDVQPALWTESIFRKLYGRTRPGGILVTYSAKGAVRRALETAGWMVDRLAGPPGKREILRGRNNDFVSSFNNGPSLSK
jgi:tRNA U34 5-methylaminomethyl-2-thiouridine-forming methyltransferase MnmC